MGTQQIPAPVSAIKHSSAPNSLLELHINCVGVVRVGLRFLRMRS